MMNRKNFFRKSMVVVLILVFALSFGAIAAEPTFHHYKTGVDTIYSVLEDGTVALGDGTAAAIPSATDGTVVIPADVTYMSAWETVSPYAVTKIRANAFLDCSAVDSVYIEGEVALEADALKGLSDAVTYETGNEKTKDALIEYGIPVAQVTYTPINTKYVAFGDSIAAGYALATYPTVETKPEMVKDTGDAYPTPADAFVALLGEELKKECSPLIVDNQAVSGWTSDQLIAQLESGAYDAALADADIITLTIGLHDILDPFMDLIMEELETVTDPETLIADLHAKLENNEALYDVCEIFQTVNQPKILELLQERAPEAEIYWTTLYNPYYGAKLELGTDSAAVLDLGKVVAPYIEEMNKAFESNNNGYHVVDLYEAFDKTGLTNAAISLNDNGTADDPADDRLNFAIDPYPNAAGHKVIADLLFDKIENTYLASDAEENDAPTALQAKVLVEKGIKTIPEGLKTTAFDTEAKIKAELIRVANKNSKFTVNEKNTEVWDVTLMVSEDGGKTWREAVAADIPQEGLAVTLPYPDKTNGSDYEFTVVHMLADDYGNKKAGDTEVLSATKLKSGLEVKMTSLSPVSVSWNKITNESGTVGTANKSPQTGDDQTVAPYIFLMLGSLLGITYLIYRRKELNK